MGSATHFVLRATSKNGISKKKVKYSDTETKPSTKSSSALRGLLQFWWRGGKTSRSLFNWKVVPRSSALKAARKAGCIKIPDVHYLDASDSARRTKCGAWRAAVETSKSVEQLALQIRELDLFIRWDDIENTHPHSLLDKESIKSIRLFKKVIVRRKCLEGTVPKYLMDFGKRRCIPDVVLKHGKKVEDPGCERKKYWLDEVYVPLYLLRSFEERRIARRAGKKSSSKSRTVGKVTKKPLREKGFDYLFSRAERVDSYPCGRCNKNVSISEAVTCQLCDGYFHKRHVIKLSGGITSGCTYTCHKCRAGKCVKKERNLRKRKFGELEEPKSLEVDSVGSPAKSRGRPKKKGKLSPSHRQVLSRNAKKKPNLEQSKSNKVPVGITLRRSARKTKFVIPNNKKVVRGKKKKSKPRKEAQRKERVSRKPKKVASKETSKGVSWQKKRTMSIRSFWLNGLLLSEKPNDERVVQFKRRKLVFPSDLSSDIDARPKCSLCSQQRFTNGLMFISCEICRDWFHGDAFGLNKGNCENLAGFKCHVCLERSPPICPFVDMSCDNPIILSEPTSEAHDAQELPLVVEIGKETDCTSPSDLPEVHTTQKTDENLDEDENLVLDTSSRIENGPPTCNEDALGLGLPDVLADLKKTYCDKDSSGLVGLPSSHTWDENLDRDEISTLDVDSRPENGLPLSKELHCDKTSSNEAIDAEELPVITKETDCVSELLCDKDISAMLESHAVPVCNENLGRVETMMSHSELRLENTASSSKELQCNEDSTNEAREINMAQVCDGVLDQGGSLKQDIESGLENGSLTTKELQSDQDKTTMLIMGKSSAANEEVVDWSTGSQDVDMEVKSEN